MWTKFEFLTWLDEIGARFNDCTELYKGQDTVYVYSRKEYDLKKEKPRKYKGLYIPYLRVSWHEEHPDSLYTRRDGWCGYMSLENVKEVCKELSL